MTARKLDLNSGQKGCHFGYQLLVISYLPTHFLTRN